ncbi:hypothetical protein PF008_g30850 [Phytophthora fragariae]|uniref:Uncharacterized protein n=1 Tax=Phytophthora fragariae TaxID=53985 RepID=A0A6G0Q4B6_9STRA|nr:hypothetical protein PF008_g30850 [Phytophthora fragariae]
MDRANGAIPRTVLRQGRVNGQPLLPRSSTPRRAPLDYLYRLNVAGLRANVPYADGSTEEKREHVEHFIRTLNTQEAELASRLTLMEVADSEALEKKLRAR